MLKYKFKIHVANVYIGYKMNIFEFKALKIKYNSKFYFSVILVTFQVLNCQPYVARDYHAAQ